MSFYNAELFITVLYMSEMSVCQTRKLCSFIGFCIFMNFSQIKLLCDYNLANLVLCTVCYMLSLRYDKWKSTLSKGSKPNNQPLMSQYTENPVYKAMHVRQRELENTVVNELIVGGNLPLTIVDTTWFGNFMKIVDPKFVMPSRRKVVNFINKAYSEKREVLRNKSSANAVSLTLDMWSDRRMRSYMGVTVHYLSHDMQPESWLLDMSSFTGSHTGEKIGNHCASLVDDLSLRLKLSYIVTDNAANMLNTFKSMPEFFPDDRCCDELTGGTVKDEEREREDQDTGGDHHTADDIKLEFDGEEPLNDETVETILSNVANDKKLRLSCGIHSLQLVVNDGFQCAKFMTPIKRLTPCKHDTYQWLVFR